MEMWNGNNPTRPPDSDAPWWLYAVLGVVFVAGLAVVALGWHR